MATEYFYRSGDRLVAHVDELADSSDFDIDPSDWDVENVEVDTYIVGASCDVKYLADPDGDFSSPVTNVTLDSFGGNGISEGNATPLQRARTSLRITNTSGSPADFIVFAERNGDGRGGQ